MRNVSCYIEIKDNLSFDRMFHNNQFKFNFKLIARKTLHFELLSINAALFIANSATLYNLSTTIKLSRE